MFGRSKIGRMKSNGLSGPESKPTVTYVTIETERFLYWRRPTSSTMTRPQRSTTLSPRVSIWTEVCQRTGCADSSKTPGVLRKSTGKSHLPKSPIFRSCAKLNENLVSSQSDLQTINDNTVCL